MTTETTPTDAESTPTTAGEPAAGTSEPPEALTAVEPAGAPETAAEPETGSAEAIRYRRRLRETEAERDTLRAERDAVRTELLADVVARAALDLAPTAVVEPGVVPAWDAVAGPDGRLDEAKVTAHLRELRTARPHLFTVRPDSAQGTTRGAPVSSSSSWDSAFKPDAFTKQ